MIFARTLDGQVPHAVLEEGLVPLDDQSDSATFRSMQTVTVSH